MNSNTIQGSMEELTRQKKGLERQLAQVENEIRQKATHNASRSELSVKCKQHAMLKKAITQMDNTLIDMQMIDTRRAIAKANQAQIAALKTMGEEMKAASGSMSPQEVQKYVADMQKQQEMNDMNSEMINSAFDSLYGVDDTEVDEETDKVLLEVAGMRMKDVVDVATRNHQTAQREQQGRTAQLDGYGFY